MSSQQATPRRLNRAFAAFFQRVKAGETPGYPRFKAVHRFDSVEWPKEGDGCRWRPDTRRVYLQGIGHVKATVPRQVEGRVKTTQVRRQGRRWMLILSCDNVPIRPLEPTRAAVGIDLGIASFATTSDGQHVPSPRYGRAAAARLRWAQQVLARKQRGSNNRGKARATLAARHRKIANQRRDFHHHAARVLVAHYDLLVVDARHTSDRCEACGHTAAENRSSQTVFSCRACGHTLNADEHAARNILRAGLARLAATPAA